MHGFGEQEPTGMAHSIAGCGIDVQAGIGAGKLHSESAPFQWTDVVFANTIIPGQEHFFWSVQHLTAPNHETLRLTSAYSSGVSRK
ncbi:hypothetical protein GCM10009813_35180 [Brevibacterium marinum]